MKNGKIKIIKQRGKYFIKRYQNPSFDYMRLNFIFLFFESRYQGKVAGFNHSPASSKRQQRTITPEIARKYE